MIRNLFRILIPWILSAGFWVLFSFSDRLYIDDDNYLVSAVTNGLYGEITVCQNMHPFLSFLLGKLSKLLPFTDVFTLFMHLALILTLGWVIHLLLRMFPGVTDRILITAFLLYLQFAARIWNINYTVWAAFFAFAGMVTLFAGKEEKERITFSVPAALMYGLGLMVRRQGALLFIPFFLLELISSFLSLRSEKSMHDKAEFRKGIISFLPLFSVVLILLLGSTIFYSYEPYRSALAYDNARVQLGDYPTKNWEEIEKEAEAAGIHETDYRAAQMWIFSDSQIMTGQNLSQMAAIGGKWAFDPTPEGILYTAQELLYDMKLNPALLLAPIAGLILLLCGILISHGKLFYKLEAAAAGIIMIIIIGYFIMRGRAPVRVWQSAYLAAASVLFLIRARIPFGERKSVRHLLQIAGVMAMLLPVLLTGLPELSFHEPTTALNARAGADEGEFASAYENNDIYLVGGYKTVIEPGMSLKISKNGWYILRSGCMEQGKLQNTEFYHHFLPMGSWVHGQPFFTQACEDVGIDNPMRALFERDNVFLLCYDDNPEYFNRLIEFLYDRYGNLRMQRIGFLAGAKVYKFRK